VPARIAHKFFEMASVFTLRAIRPSASKSKRGPALKRHQRFVSDAGSKVFQRFQDAVYFFDCVVVDEADADNSALLGKPEPFD
jgi:hypothetical protein